MTSEKNMLKIKILINKYNACEKQLKLECEKEESLKNWLNGDKTIEKLKSQRKQLEKQIEQEKEHQKLFNKGVNLMHLWSY